MLPSLLVLFLLHRSSLGAVAASPVVSDPGDSSHTVCAVRKLAYERALAQQPHHAPLRKFHDALQLHTLCGEPPLPVSAAGTTQRPAGSASAGSGAVLVDPLLGDDTVGQPFRTIGAAVAAARRGSGGAKPLVLSSGIHFLNETLMLTDADSGFSISAAPGAEGSAWLSGGVPLTGLQWSKEANGIWAAKITNPAVQDGIPGLLTVDDTDHSPSSRLVRARYPNGNWEIDMWGLVSGVSTICLPICPLLSRLTTVVTLHALAARITAVLHQSMP